MIITHGLLTSTQNVQDTWYIKKLITRFLQTQEVSHEKIRTTQYEGEVKKLRIKVEQLKKDLLGSEEKVKNNPSFSILNPLSVVGNYTVHGNLEI